MESAMIIDQLEGIQQFQLVRATEKATRQPYRKVEQE